MGKGTPTDKTRVVSTRRRLPTNWVSGRTLQPSIESVVANSFVPSDFLVDGQVSGLGTMHPFLTLSLFGTWILPLHAVSCCVFNVEEEVVIIQNGWTPKRERRRQLKSSIIIIAVETSRVFGESTPVFLSNLGSSNASAKGDVRERTWLIQRISMAVLRGNTISIAMSCRRSFWPQV